MAKPVESTGVEKYLDALPQPDEIRAKIAANLQERQLLQRLLKLSRQRQAAQEAAR